MSVKYMSMVWSDMPELDKSNLLVMLSLADHANDDGVCWPSIKLLAKKSRISTRQTKRIIKSLKERGYLIEEEAGGGRGNCTTYRLQQKGDIVSPFGSDKESAKNDTKAQEKGDISDTKGDIASHAREEPSLEPTTETSKPNTIEPNGSADDAEEVSEEKPKRKLSDWNRLVAGITYCVHNHTDFSILPQDGPAGRGVITREAKIIKDAKYTAEDVWEWWNKVWKPRYSWTEKQGGEIKRPTPVEVRAGIPAIRALPPEEAKGEKSPEALAKRERTLWENMDENERGEEREFRDKISKRFKPRKEMSDEELDEMMADVGVKKIA